MILEVGPTPEFVWLPTFERLAEGLLSEADRRELEEALIANPGAGSVIPRAGGFRKLRVAAKGKGKRGGARVVYLHVPRRERIYMVLVYGKDTRARLSEGERVELAKIATALKGE